MPTNWERVRGDTPPPADGQPAAQSMFVPRRPRLTLAGLAVPAAVARRIELALARIAHHSTVYVEWGLGGRSPYGRGTALNFYGPPGTGKTHAAEGIAERLNRTFIDVNYSAIESKYVGETPKNIEHCFAVAEDSDSVLVFNEADSILGSRLSNVTQSADHAVNVSRAVMLAQLDRFTGIAVFTTNFPANYDPAFVRRIGTHIRFDLPDLPTRDRLWRELMPAELPRDSAATAPTLAAASDGLSGADICNVLLAAAFRAATRKGAARLVTLADLTEEIQAVRQANTEVGRPRAQTRLVDETALAAARAGAAEQRTP